MSKFCRYCGKKLEDYENCNCPEAKKADDYHSDSFQSENKAQKKTFIDRIKAQMGLHTIENKGECFERTKEIAPDCITPDVGEIPIRQYHIATLRSVFKGMFSEGRLQVTNKRVLFRGAGISLLGTTELQYEFAIDEIAGIEIRRDHRIGVLHFILALIVSCFFTQTFAAMFRTFAETSSFFANLFSFVLFVVSVLFFFFVKKKLGLKLICLLVATGAISALAFSIRFFVIPVSNGGLYTVFYVLLTLLLCINIIILGFVPNLVLAIKTKSASNPIEIRRKENSGIFAFLLNLPKKEYTGFSDVMPGEDVAKAIKELGAMINDLNMLGDAAIEKWSEK